MIKDKLNSACFKILVIVGTLLSFTMFSNVYAKENYIVVLVNNLPITKIDVVDRAKLISYSINQDFKFKNLHKFYDQSLKSLIKDSIKRHAGLQYNPNILNSVNNEAYKRTLSNYQNSEKILNEFINKISISKASIVNRYKTQIIWEIVLKKKFKQQFVNINKEIKKLIKLDIIEKNKDKYDLAEIVLPKKNNLELYNKIMASLKLGTNFSNIAKQISISPSAKFGGKIGWKKFEDLPDNIIQNASEINEGDLFNFTTKDTINILKVLVKRNKGNLSPIEDKVVLAQINFQINFGNKKEIYSKIKNKLSFLLKGQKSCNALKIINSEKNENLSVNVINARIADIDKRLRKGLKNFKLFKYIGPMYKGNNGYLFVFCAKRKMKLEDINPDLIKKSMINKRFVIFNAKLLKKTTQNAVIKTINQIN